MKKEKEEVELEIEGHLSSRDKKAKTIIEFNLLGNLLSLKITTTLNTSNKTSAKIYTQQDSNPKPSLINLKNHSNLHITLKNVNQP